jgi:hypothetical protein
VSVSARLRSVTIEEAIELRMVWAALGLPIMACGISPWPKYRSMAVVPSARPMAPSMQSTGTTQKLEPR